VPPSVLLSIYIPDRENDIGEEENNHDIENE
jgi:hypothetical protein